MKKRTRKVVASVLGVAMVAPMLLTGCKMSEVIEIDETKTQLYIGNYDGGIGHEWLDNVIEEFEEKYADYSFEEGKNGAEILVTNDKSPYLAPNLISTIALDREEIFFTEYVTNFYDFVSTGDLLPITDFITVQQEDGTTIESRLSDVQKEYYKVNGEYYALPHYETYSSIVYDVDLFDTYLLYYAEEGYGDADGFLRPQDAIYEEEARLAKGLNSHLSKGPDNVKGTMDDGLPATYQQFYKLCDKMLRLNITPISWTGNMII